MVTDGTIVARLGDMLVGASTKSGCPYDCFPAIHVGHSMLCPYVLRFFGGDAIILGSGQFRLHDGFFLYFIEHID